jgi:hypothetical protein
MGDVVVNIVGILDGIYNKLMFGCVQSWGTPNVPHGNLKHKQS